MSATTTYRLSGAGARTVTSKGVVSAPSSNAHVNPLLGGRFSRPQAWGKEAKNDSWMPAADMQRGAGVLHSFPETQEPPETTAPATHPIGPDPLFPTLRATPLTLRVKPDRTLAWVSGGLGNTSTRLLLLSTGLGWQATDPRLSPQPTPTPRAIGTMDAARWDVLRWRHLSHPE